MAGGRRRHEPAPGLGKQTLGGGAPSLQGPRDGPLQPDALVPRPGRRSRLGLPVGLRVQLVHLHLELSQGVTGRRSQGREAVGRAGGAVPRVGELVRDALKTTQLMARYTLHQQRA